MGATEPSAQQQRRPSSYVPRGPVKRAQRTYSRRRKQDVLLFLIHHRIPLQRNYYNQPIRPTRGLSGLPGGDVADGLRRPTVQEAADHFQIAGTGTISTWWRQREAILGARLPRDMLGLCPSSSSSSTGQQQQQVQVQGRVPREERELELERHDTNPSERAPAAAREQQHAAARGPPFEGWPRENPGTTSQNWTPGGADPYTGR